MTTETVMIASSNAKRIVGDGAAYLSLSVCVSFWILFALSFVPRLPLPEVTNVQIFKTMGVAVLLAIVSLALRSKLWKFALPFALVMFFFVWYVMVS